MVSACNGKKPRYKCPYCAYISRYPSDTYKHAKRMHEGYDVFAIDVLNMRRYYPPGQENKIMKDSQSKLVDWYHNVPPL